MCHPQKYKNSILIQRLLTESDGMMKSEGIVIDKFLTTVLHPLQELDPCHGLVIDRQKVPCHPLSGESSRGSCFGQRDIRICNDSRILNYA